MDCKEKRIQIKYEKRDSLFLRFFVITGEWSVHREFL